MNIIWSLDAEQDRADVWDHIAADNPGAAARMDGLFSEAAGMLADHPMMGRRGRIRGTRELVVHSNYLLVYQIQESDVWILALVHAARRWPPLRNG